MRKEKPLDNIKLSNKLNFYLILILTGAIFNLTAMVFNGNRMPVYMWDVDSERHFGFYNWEEVRHPFITDIIPFYFFKASIGDICIFWGVTGIFINFYRLIMRMSKEKMKGGRRYKRR